MLLLNLSGSVIGVTTVSGNRNLSILLVEPGVLEWPIWQPV